MTRKEALDVLTGWLPMVKLRKYKAAMQVAIDALSTPELPAELEKAATEFATQDCVTFISRKKGFIAGAKWQAEQDKEIIEVAEDHAMLAGMNKMKEEMLEKAVDGRVIKSYNPVTAIGQPTLHGIELIYPDRDKPYLIAGDKVKMIVIPEEK